MNAELTSRAGAASGVLGTGLIFTGLMITNGATESTSVADAPATIAASFLAHRGEIRLGVTLALAGVFLAIWFLAHVRQRLRAADPGGLLATVAFGGGVIGFGGLLAYLAVLVAATNESIAAAPESARSLLILNWEFGGVIAPAYGALVGAVSLAVLRHRLLPWPARSLAVVGLPLALALALSGFLGGFLVVLALVWLFGLSVAFLLPQPAAASRRAGRGGREVELRFLLISRAYVVMLVGCVGVLLGVAAAAVLA
jgi:hypothetical protein